MSLRNSVPSPIAVSCALHLLQTQAQRVPSFPNGHHEHCPPGRLFVIDHDLYRVLQPTQSLGMPKMTCTLDAENDVYAGQTATGWSNRGEPGHKPEHAGPRKAQERCR